MANTSTLFIGGKDIKEFGVILLEYKEPLLASPKDGGGLDVEGVDGIIPTRSSVFKNLSGHMEVLVEGETVIEVMDIIRSFKQYLRESHYTSFSSLENIGFYRVGKVDSGEIVSMTDLPEFREAKGIFKFEIIFKDSYEYSSTKVTNVIEPNGNNIVEAMELYNRGKSTRDFKVTYEATAPVNGIMYVEMFIPKNGTWVRAGKNLSIGLAGSTTLSSGQKITINFSKPEILLTDGTTTADKISLYTAGQFFEVPQGRFRLSFNVFEDMINGIRLGLTHKIGFELEPKFY